MSKLNCVLCLLVFVVLTCAGQEDCTFARDTMFVPKEQQSVSGEYLETTLKNMSVVRLFKGDNNKFYMRLMVTQDFYFDKVDVLEIRSGSKSYYAKDTKQYKVSKTKGMYVIEIFKNYISTLKEDGITSIVFSNAETDFTRQDASQIRKIAKCLYDTAFAKK